MAAAPDRWSVQWLSTNSRVLISAQSTSASPDARSGRVRRWSRAARASSSSGSRDRVARNSSSTASASQRSDSGQVLDPAGLDLLEQRGVGHEEKRLRQRRRCSAVRSRRPRPARGGRRSGRRGRGRATPHGSSRSRSPWLPFGASGPKSPATPSAALSASTRTSAIIGLGIGAGEVAPVVEVPRVRLGRPLVGPRGQDLSLEPADVVPVGDEIGRQRVEQSRRSRAGWRPRSRRRDRPGPAPK